MFAVLSPEGAMVDHAATMGEARKVADVWTARTKTAHTVRPVPADEEWILSMYRAISSRRNQRLPISS